MPMSFNRLFTVTGSTVETERQYPTYFYYGGLTDANFFLNGEFRALDSAGDTISGTMVSAITGAAKLQFHRRYKNSDDNTTTLTNGSSFMVGTAAKQIWLVDPDGNQIATWDVDGDFRDLVSLGSFYAVEADVMNGQLVGMDADITETANGGDGPAFQFSQIFANVTTTTSRSRRVWGRLVELGEAAGLVQITSDLDSAEDVAFSAQSRASLRTRFYADIRLASQVTDDEGIDWQVSSARALDGRRFLEFELFRTIVQAEG